MPKLHRFIACETPKGVNLLNARLLEPAIDAAPVSNCSTGFFFYCNESLTPVKPLMTNALSRYATFPLEAALFGPAYGWLRFKIRSPEPLNAEAAWNEVTGKIPPVFDWLRQNYPPTFMRSWLIASKMRQAHVKGIAAHYDVSNDFYKLFLDDKYMFYTCADFPTGNETIEEAQTIKANHLISLIEPRPGEKILELGCGWGAMLKRIFEETGDKENLHGFTLSQE